MTAPKRVFVALAVLFVAQAVYYYPKLPDTVASHFGVTGQPNGWSSKAQFFGVMYGMVALMVLIFWGLPKAISRVPTKWISLPYRDHWLSEGRRAGTMHFIDIRISWFGVATLLLIVVTAQLTINANLGAHPVLPARYLWVVYAYLAYSVVWAAFFVAHFFRIRKGPHHP